MTINTLQNGINTLAPSSGMVLTNGNAYSAFVYIGRTDSAANWSEIPESEVPAEIIGGYTDYQAMYDELAAAAAEDIKNS